MLTYLLGVLTGMVLTAAGAALWLRRRGGGEGQREADAPAEDSAAPDSPPREAPSAELATLARGLAHEIRNPLSTMRVNLQLMREDLAVTETDREQRIARKVEVLQQEVQRLQDILDDFLRYARGHKLNPVRVNINEVVGDLIAFFEPQAHQHNIRLHSQFDPDLPECLVDVDLIKQALFNIMLNAQQAMPRGGELILRTSAADGAVLIEIIDTGPGVPEGIRDRIFDAFFSTKQGGSGLGLAMTKRIVDQHGGTIRFHSEPGTGTDFVISIPTASEPAGDDT